MNDRTGQMEALTRLGVDGAWALCEDLDDEAINGVIRWGNDQARRGSPASSGAIANKLRAGGLAGFGELSGAPTAWYRSWQGRERWIETNVSELDYEYAESAIISLVQQKKNPTSETVRACAQLLEQDQLAHDEKCRHAVAGQRALSGREQVAREGDGSAERGARDAASAAEKARDPLAGSRPESVQKAAA